MRRPSAGFKGGSPTPRRQQSCPGGRPYSPSREAEKAATFPGAGRSWTLKGAAQLSGPLSRGPRHRKGGLRAKHLSYWRDALRIKKGSLRAENRGPRLDMAPFSLPSVVTQMIISCLFRLAEPKVVKLACTYKMKTLDHMIWEDKI